MCASGSCPVCIVCHTRRSWQGLACALSPSARRSLPGPASGSGGFRRNAARRIEYSRTQQKSCPREDGFDGSQRKGQSG